MLLCDVLTPYYTLVNGATLHILWHVGAAYGAYSQCLCFVLARSVELGVSVEMTWVLCCVPVITVRRDEYSWRDGGSGSDHYCDTSGRGVASGGRDVGKSVSGRKQKLT